MSEFVVMALKLIKSYFSNRTQRVQIDNVLSDFANIICGVPQGSVLGPLKFCLYLLPLSAILRYHNIGYHVYAQMVKVHINNTKHITIANIYIPPRDSTSTHYKTA